MRIDAKSNIPARAAPVFALLLCASAARLSAVEGIPHWERVLNEVLERAEREQIDSQQGFNAVPPARAPGVSGGNAPPPVVASFVRYFQGPGLKRYRASVERLQEYRPMISRVLSEEGLPPQLVWIGLVESGFDPGARSPKSARGIWQLMPETASAFGLIVAHRDERTDPEKSTRAAARYLKYLCARFGDWALTLAAYNAGERRVQSAIERAGERSFWRLSGSGMLPRETQAYVPAVLAAQILGGDSPELDGSSANDDATSRAGRVALAPYSLSR